MAHLGNQRVPKIWYGDFLSTHNPIHILDRTYGPPPSKYFAPGAPKDILVVLHPMTNDKSMLHASTYMQQHLHLSQE